MSYYYSLANKAFDYIQAGIPSIHMNFPEYRALNDQFDVFLLLDTLTPEAIAIAIQRLLDDSAVYQQLHHHCLIAREVLNWEIEETRLIELYQDVLSIDG